MSAERHARAKEVFLEALERRGDERAAYLAHACADDPDLRAEVELLLVHDQRPLALLELAADGAGARVLADALERERASPVALPERIAGCRVLRVLGEGGMGSVYEAEQETPRRRVAIKVMRRGLETAGLLRRFEHETHILGRLNHPGIAQVYEAGVETADGAARPYCLMELVEGRTLSEHARELDLRAKVELVAQVCEAVEHAHQHGVLHRDLKPGNIVVGANGQAKVLDFGVARLLDHPGETTCATGTNSVLGTLAYMSPEQVSGGATELDARSDVYALGVIAYELLSGRMPYDVRATSLPHAARIICEVEPLPAALVNRMLSGDLETILTTALAKDRERRYASAAELGADLRRFLRDEPIIARPASTLYQLRKFARRNRALVTGALIASATLVAATVVSVWLARAEHRERTRADRAASAAAREAYRANVLAAGLALVSDNPRYARDLLADLRADDGGWEYRRLRRLTEQWLAEVRTGSGHVWFVAFAPGGRTAVAALQNGAVVEWDLASDSVAQRVGPDPRRADPRALSADGSRCVSLDDVGAFVWDTRTGETTQHLAFDAKVDPWGRNLADFSPDATRFAVATRDRGTLLFDLGSGSGPSALRLDADGDGFVAFSGDGRILATSAGDTPVAWDAASGALLRRFERIDGLRCLAVDPGGSRIAAGAGGSVHLLDLASARELRVLRGHPDVVTSLAFAPGTALLAAQLDDGSVWIWDADSGAPLQRNWGGRPSWKTSLAWSPDRSTLLTGAHVGGVLRLWDVDPPRDPEVLRGHTSFVYPVAFSPDGTRIASGGWDNALRLWSADDGRARAALEGHRGRVTALAWSPDARRVASTSTDGRVIVWDAWSAARLAELSLDTPLKAAAWSPDGSLLALGVGAPADGVRLLAADGLEPRGELPTEGAVHALAFSPDGGRLVVAGSSQPTTLWDVAERRLLVGRAAGARVNAVRWSRDGRSLALACDAGLAILLDATTLEQLHELRAHPREVFSVDFSPDGLRLFSGGRDGRLLVWDVESGSLVGQFEGHDDYIWALDVSPDGTRVVTGSGDRTVRQWESASYRETGTRRRRATHLEAEVAPLVERLFAELGDASAVVARLEEACATGAIDGARRTAALLRVLATAPAGRDADAQVGSRR